MNDNFICQQFTDENKKCYCGKETIGITLDGFKPIHKGENGELIICEHKYKVGEYVIIKYSKCGLKTGYIAKIHSIDGLNNYSVWFNDAGGAIFREEDLIKIKNKMPKTEAEIIRHNHNIDKKIEEKRKENGCDINKIPEMRVLYQIIDDATGGYIDIVTPI